MGNETVNILLVEDEQAHAELIQRAFERYENKYNLSIAQTISEAKTLIETSPFGLILSDWRLPDGKGTQLIEIQEKNPKTPVVIMTGHGNERVAVEAIKAGALDYVVKSDVALADMAHTVERAMREWENRIQREQAEAQLKRRVSELEAVNRVSTAMRTAETLHEMIPRLMDEILAILNAQCGAFWLYNSVTGKLERFYIHGPLDQIPAEIQPEECIAATSLATKEIHLIPKFAHEKGSGNLPQEFGGACTPILAGKDVVGALLVGVALPRELKQTELHLLSTLSEIAGNAIQRTRLHEKTKHSLERLATLRSIDQAITSNTDIHVTLNILLGHARGQLGADAVGILRLDPHMNHLTYFAGQGFGSVLSTPSPIRIGEGYAGLAVLERRPIFASEVQGLSLVSGRTELATTELFKSYHVMPLTVKGQVKGVMETFHRNRYTPDEEWKNYFESLANQAAIAIDNAELFENLQKSNVDLRVAYNATIEGWSRALDLRDKETEGHTQRVMDKTLKLAEVMGVKKENLDHIRRGALLHDIGKMGIPDQLLHKPGPLNEEEWTIMRKHPEFAYEMLSPISYLHDSLNIPLYHHEKWDGTGYPRKLKGEEIPLEARIFAVVDVWDALLSDRPYRKAWSKRETLQYLIDQKGSHFEPQIVDAFLKLIK
jgi:putative nucleotidyltransferase with HDIG domain